LGVRGGGPLAHVVDQRQQRRIGEAAEDERTRGSPRTRPASRRVRRVKRSVGQEETFAYPRPADQGNVGLFGAQALLFEAQRLENNWYEGHSARLVVRWL
jgi:hypothetical protein